MWNRHANVAGLLELPTRIASAATLNIPDDKFYFDLTGTTTINKITIGQSAPGRIIRLRAVTGPISLTSNDATDPMPRGSFNFAGGGSITLTAAQDVIDLMESADGYWEPVSAVS